MQYYVFKNDEQTGPFALMDVRARLQDGTFAYEDLAWCEGMADWTPLKEILGGALPDATPHSVSEWTTAPAAAPAKAPSLLRLITSIVLFVVAFAVIAAAAWAVASFVCAVIVAAQAAFSHQAQGTGNYVEAGKHASMGYFWIFVVSAAVFSLIVSPVVAWMMAYSNLLPWCRAR